MMMKLKFYSTRFIYSSRKLFAEGKRAEPVYCLTNSQTINLSVNNSNCIIDKSSLNFTSINYNVEQTVTVTGVHDANSYVDKNSIITLSNPNITRQTNKTEYVRIFPSLSILFCKGVNSFLELNNI